MTNGSDVAVCFFGITRALWRTMPSIEENVLVPARRAAQARGGRVIVCAHLYEQHSIENPRSGESGAMPADEHVLLKADRLALEAPGPCLEQWDFEGLKTFGDEWQDEFSSLRNLVHQLHSLREVTRLAVEEGTMPGAVVFARPDLEYHDSLLPLPARALAAARPTVWLPGWQSWTGRNDRFAICTADAAATYGTRVERMHEFCRRTGGALHAERLLGYVLETDRIRVRTMARRASRVRAGGARVAENFSSNTLRKARLRASRLAENAGLGPLARATLGRLSFGRRQAPPEPGGRGE